MPNRERRSDRWVPALQSVLLHGTIVGVLVLGWWTLRGRPKPQPTLALNASIVSPKALEGTNVLRSVSVRHAPVKPAIPPPKPVPVKVPPLEAPPPKLTAVAPAPSPPSADIQTVPVPSDLAARAAASKQAARAKAQAQVKARKAAQKQRQAVLNAEARARRTAAEAKKKAAEAKAAAKRRAEQRRLAEAKRKAEQKLAAEKKRRAEQKRKAELARRAAEAKALALNQAALSASIAREEKTMTARSAPALASWEAQIKARIEHAWIRPPSAKHGVDCILDVTQVPGGEIVNATVGACNGDEAVVQSIQDAAYRASPLPPPPDPSLFERNLQIEFKPN